MLPRRRSGIERRGVWSRSSESRQGLKTHVRSRGPAARISRNAATALAFPCGGGADGADESGLGWVELRYISGWQDALGGPRNDDTAFGARRLRARCPRGGPPI